MNLDQAKIKMAKCVEHLQEQLIHFTDSGLTSSMIDTLKVEIDGGSIEVRYVALTSDTKEEIVIRPYDPLILGKLSKEISKSGINSFVSGKAVICPTSKTLKSDDREKVENHIKKLGEEAKVAVRMVRQELRNSFAKDKIKENEKPIQELTDAYIVSVENCVKSRIKDFK